MADNSIKIILNAVDNASNSIKKVNGELGKLDDTTEKHDVTLGDAIKSTALWASGIAIAGEAIKKAGKFVKDSIDETVTYNSEIQKLTLSTGLSADSISRLVQIGDSWGISLEKMGTLLDYANQHGFSPTIDNLAKLADEYVNTKDKTEFAAEAQKIFGHSYADIIPILAEGGNALKEAAAAVSDNLIATDESIAKTREYQEVMGELNDTWTGFKHTIGEAVIPTITILVKKVNDNAAAADDLNSTLDTLEQMMDRGIITEKEYSDIAKQLAVHGANVNDVLDNANALLEKNEAAYKGATAGLVPYSDYTRELNGIMGDSSAYYELLFHHLDNTTDSLAGMETQSFYTTEEVKRLQGGIDLLNDATMSLVNDAISAYTDSLAESMIMQAAFQLAMGDITQAEFDQTVAMAPAISNLEEMNKLLEDGSITWNDYFNAIEDGKVTTDELIKNLEDAGMSASDAATYVANLALSIDSLHDKSITIKVHVPTITELEGLFGQHGADFVVPPGFPNDSFPLHVSSGEHVTVIPQGGGNQNTTNNYFNQTVHTNAQSSTVMRDFNMMKAMAG
jgi:hypothetical protein